MAAAVIYWSGTGNTEAMAKAVAQGAGVEAVSVTDFGGNIADFDALALGSPAMGDEVLEESEFEPFFAGIEDKIGGKKVDLKNVTMPVLCACAERDHLVPLSASKPLMDVIGSEDKQFVSFATGHIGMYVSSKSQKMIVPQIVEWIKARS